MANEEKKEVKYLKIERETYESKTNEERFAYFVKGTIRGKDVKASIIPGDIGGYEVLDIVFGPDKSANLITEQAVMTDANGKEVSYKTYNAQNIDKDTKETFICKVKPRQSSDKSIIEMLLARL